MGRVVQHPNRDMERLLQELESQGADPAVIESYVVRALAREASRKQRAALERAAPGAS